MLRVLIKIRIKVIIITIIFIKITKVIRISIWVIKIIQLTIINKVGNSNNHKITD